jgi:hypothetical protein
MKARYQNLWRGVVLSLCVLFVIPSSAIAEKGGERLKPIPPNKKPEKSDKEKKPDSAKGDEEKPFDEVIKDMEVLKGLFTFYRKADENRILLEILPEQLEKTFLFAATVDRSVGERGLYAAQVSGDFPFYFHRVGKSIQWLIKNPSFTAASNTPAARATARSFPESILASAKVKSKPHVERKSLLIDISDLLISDLPGIANGLKEIYKPTDYAFDKNNSSVSAVKTFPDNILIELWLHYTTANPKTPSITLPDARSIPILMKYEFSSLKETTYQPRLADDRVGYFLTVQQDFTSDRPSSPYNRYVNRWFLEQADPKAPLSPPREPIVFWLENTIPIEYREWMKEGVLLWNKAFEKIGFKDAIVVKQQPDDADWDPADTRYSTIRWFAGVDASFAIGPSRANPFTGQIYDADIGFSEGIIRSVRRQGEEFVAPVLPPAQELPALLPLAWRRDAYTLCSYADGLAQQAAFGINVLDARGALTPEVEEKLMREFIIEVTAHEVGHTLGLRHNFRASTILNPDELNDIQKTSEISQSGSVMDYNPIIIAAKGEKQGHFVPITLGPYDYWAIEYAYKPIEGDEKTALAKIASRDADPLLPYSTDEDALGTYSPSSIDPLVNQFDASSDPLGYFRKRFGIVNELWTSMESKLVKPGEGYQVLRRALGRGLNEYFRGLVTSSKYIGGIYHYRDHAGDPNGRSPYVPVPADKQREALELLRQFAFREDSFRLPPGVLNKLAIDRLPSLGGIGDMFNTQRIDYPWHDSVLNLQRALLNRFFHPVTLGRLQDNELRFAESEKAFLMSDLFSGLENAIWAELDTDAAKISSLRRNLQREHMKQLIRLALRSGQSGVPEDASTLAGASLASIQTKIHTALNTGKITDPTSNAHLQETDARITAALQAQMQKPLE